MNIKIKESDIIKAAGEGLDEFVNLFTDAILDSVNGEITVESMQTLSADQITLVAYRYLHQEVMDGGFVQLIFNGLGGFIFENPFAYVLKQWGLKDLSKMIYNVKTLYFKHREEIMVDDCTDEEFMAMFEKFPDFDDFDDEFVENEEEWTSDIATYIDEHIEKFCEVEK